MYRIICDDYDTRIVRCEAQLPGDWFFKTYEEARVEAVKYLRNLARACLAAAERLEIEKEP